MFEWLTGAERPPFTALVDGPVTIIKLAGPEVREPEHAQALGPALKDYVRQYEIKDALLDLSEIGFMGSTGFAVILGLWKQCQADGTKLVLCGLRPEVELGAGIVGLTRLVPTFPHERDALAHWAMATS